MAGGGSGYGNLLLTGASGASAAHASLQEASVDLRVTYDRMADSTKIHLVDSIGFGGVAKSTVCDLESVDAAINLDFDCDDRLIAIELRGASRLLPDEPMASEAR